MRLLLAVCFLCLLAFSAEAFPAEVVDPKSFADFESFRLLTQNVPENLANADAAGYQNASRTRSPDLLEFRNQFAKLFESTGVSPMNRPEVKALDRPETSAALRASKLLEQSVMERLAVAVAVSRVDGSKCDEVEKALRLLFLVSEASQESGLGIETNDVALYLHFLRYGTKFDAVPCVPAFNRHAAVFSRLLPRSGVKDVRLIARNSKRTHTNPFDVDLEKDTMKVRTFEPSGTRPSSLPADSVVVIMPDLLLDGLNASRLFSVTWGGPSRPDRAGDPLTIESKWISRWSR